nr:MAG TPA: hypothetical protein [Caudoviricetes sp.]
MMDKPVVIEGVDFNDILHQECAGCMKIYQEKDFICIDKHQAVQLIKVLRLWVDGEGIE